MSSIKLKPIKPGMVIHCPTEENAKQLLEYLDGLGYEWSSSSEKLLERTRYDVYGENTCYSVEENTEVMYSDVDYFKNEGEEITEFSDLIEPELTAEEAFEILSDIKNCKGRICANCPLSNYCAEGSAVFVNRGNKKLLEICRQWKADHEKKEPEVEWHFHAEVHGNGFDSIKNCGSEEEAIQFVEEELKKAGKDAWGKYERICRVKEVN